MLVRSQNAIPEAPVKLERSDLGNSTNKASGDTAWPNNLGFSSKPPRAESKVTQTLKLDDYGPISLGNSYAKLHGLEPRGVVVETSFMKGGIFPEGKRNFRGGRIGGPIVNLVPDPVADAYLNFIAATAVRDGEKALTLRLQPGMLKGLIRQGILRSTDDVIQVDPDISSGGIGYPSTDPLAQVLKAQVSGIPLGGMLSAVLQSDTIRYQAERLGLNSFKANDGLRSNHKAIFQQDSDKYNLDIAPGAVINHENEIAAALALIGKSKSLWVKAPLGSGGDFVQHIKAANGEFVTSEEVKAAMAKLRKSERESFERNNYSPTQYREFHPENKNCPLYSSVVLQRDVRDYADPGTEPVIGSFMIAINQNGEFAVPAFFEQITDEGWFRGGKPLYPAERFGHHHMQAIYESIEPYAHYLYNKHNFRGIGGCDCVFVQHQGRMRLFKIDPNTRPTILTMASVVADKAGTKDWWNLNIWAPHDLLTFDDFARAVGYDLVYGENLAPELKGAKVIPMALRSLYHQDKPIVKSNVAKVLVCGDSREVVNRVVEMLEKERGIKFNSAGG